MKPFSIVLLVLATCVFAIQLYMMFHYSGTPINEPVKWRNF